MCVYHSSKIGFQKLGNSHFLFGSSLGHKFNFFLKTLLASGSKFILGSMLYLLLELHAWGNNYGHALFTSCDLPRSC